MYRLSPGPYLPTRWCYSDPWERSDEDGEWLDCRAEGFQVLTAEQVALAALGLDGDTPFEDASLVLLIDVEGDTVDGCGSYLAASPEQVRGVRAVGLETLREFLDGMDEDAIYDSAEAIEDFLAARAVETQIQWRDTLPRPE